MTITITAIIIMIMIMIMIKIRIRIMIIIIIVIKKTTKLGFTRTHCHLQLIDVQSVGSRILTLSCFASFFCHN